MENKTIKIITSKWRKYLALVGINYYYYVTISLFQYIVSAGIFNLFQIIIIIIIIRRYCIEYNVDVCIDNFLKDTTNFILNLIIIISRYHCIVIEIFRTKIFF